MAIIPLGIVILMLVCFGARWDPEGLTLEGQRAIGLFLFCMIFWVTRALPLAVTSLTVFALAPSLGIVSARETFSYFGNEAVFFILGALLLAGGMFKTGISQRIAVFLLSRFGGSPESLVSGILVSSALLSCLMPEHAVCALLFPVVLDIAKALSLVPGRSNLGKAMFFALTWGCVIGGITTLLGGARNPLALNLYENHLMSHGLEPARITFLEWMYGALPITVCMLFSAFLLVRWYFPSEVTDVKGAQKFLIERSKDLGPLSIDEWKVAIVYTITIMAWVAAPQLGWGLAQVGLLGATSLFLLNVLTWEDADGYVQWGVVLMYGGAIGLAECLGTTGASSWIVGKTLLSYDLGPWMLLTILILVTKLLTEVISNVAAVSLVLPIALQVGSEAQIPLMVVVFIVALPAGLAFCLPMGTPPNAICYSSGYYSIRDSTRTGLVLNVISWVVVLLAAKFYWPLLGLSVVTASP